MGGAATLRAFDTYRGLRGKSLHTVKPGQLIEQSSLIYTSTSFIPLSHAMETGVPSDDTTLRFTFYREVNCWGLFRHLIRNWTTGSSKCCFNCVLQQACKQHLLSYKHSITGHINP